MNAYGTFAQSYDRMMHDVDYAAWSDYIDKLLKRANVKTVLECACGTGAVTIPLAKQGYGIIGTDISEEMLMEARKSALQAGLRMLPFVQQNMTALSVHKPVDAVLSCCDGVNYLTDMEEAAAFFKSANRCLKTGGLLLFDISSAYKLSTVIGNTTYTETAEDYAYIWENMFDPETRLIEMNLTFFVQEGSLYKRFSEQHIQRAHTEQEILSLLQQNGFSECRAFDAFTDQPVRPDSERIQFTAIKKETV